MFSILDIIHFYIVALILTSFSNTVYAATSKDKDKDVVGIGFDLSWNYATVAISLPNGSSFPIAKIEGSRAYRDAILQLTRPGGDTAMSSSLDENSSFFSKIIPTVKLYSGYAYRNATFHFFRFWTSDKDSSSYHKKRLSLLRNYLPLSLQNTILTTLWPDPKATAIQEMLDNLYSVTTTYLHNEPISLVGLSLPFSLKLDAFYRKGSFDSILRRVNLRPTIAFTMLAAEVASEVNGIGNNFSACIEPGSYPDPELVLVIERTKCAIVLTVFIEHFCWFTKAKPVVLDLNLGADALLSGKIAEDHYWQQVHQYIESLNSPPFGESDGDAYSFDAIRRVILMGDSVFDNPRLLAILRDVLGEEIIIGASPGFNPPSPITMSKGQMADPLYAAALGAADSTLFLICTQNVELEGILSYHRIDEL